jgi:antirestriction protein ArdC
MSKFDLYQTVTDRIVSLMQTHGANWVNPFKKTGKAYRPMNPTTGKAYQGMNQFLLATTEFALPMWAGFGQWKDKGCMVKRGSKSTMIVYWNILERITTVNGVAKLTKRPLLRYLNVFNIDQVEGAYADSLRASWTVVEPTPAETVATLEIADAFFASVGAEVRHSNNDRAYYSPALDHIHMPNKTLFSATPTSSATEAYYGTLAHELTHWTGHESRLAREFSGRFGSEAYAFEELVAELGSAMLSAQLGISVEPRADHAQYLNNWIKVLKGDNAAIIKAATLAKQAAAYLSKASEEEATEEEAIAA